MKHYAHPYLLNPQHPVTINLIGCGGTGSQVLTCLARMNYALHGLGHPGFMVWAWDPDEVSTTNIGRQLFSPGEIGLNKAVLLVTKVNRFFGIDWKSEPRVFDGSKHSNITITCVDEAQTRVDIGQMLDDEIIAGQYKHRPYKNIYYWLDFGNSQKSGQVILGTFEPIEQPNGDYTDCAPSSLPTVIDLFPDILEQEKDEIQGPSCSLADALQKQSLFINSTLAQLGCALLFDLFREGGVENHGLFLNLDTMKVNPIPVV